MLGVIGGSGFYSMDEIENKEERHAKLAQDYLKLSGKKTAPLVVSPTRREGREVTNAIRNELTERGKLGKKSKEFTRFRNLHLETAQRREPERYLPGMMIQYHQNGKGVTRGERFTVSQISEDGKIAVKNSGGETRELNLKEAKKFQVFEPQKIELRNCLLYTSDAADD